MVNTCASAAIDLSPLWDFQNPAVSEQRFRAALATANADDQLILQTQIARTYGLRRDFLTARELLVDIAAAQANGSAEAQARYQLELGRTYASATHPQPMLDRDIAKSHYQKAFEIAERARLDYLAVDALHMMPFVETDPAKKVEWNERAIAFVMKSDQPDAKRWEGSLRNNIGYALHVKGDYENALREFRLSRAAFEAADRRKEVRIADWMIAWTLRAQKMYREALLIQQRIEPTLALTVSTLAAVGSNGAMSKRSRSSRTRTVVHALPSAGLHRIRFIVLATSRSGH